MNQNDRYENEAPAGEIEVVIAEFSALLRQRPPHQWPAVDDCCARYPQLGDELRELLNTVLALEKSKIKPTPRWKLPRIERIGDYRIVREIGRGGMGVVFEAIQESLQRRVAIKVFPHNALLNQKQLQRFHREAKIAARLHHSNIIPILSVGQDDDYHYYAMPLVQAVSLDRFIGQQTAKHAIANISTDLAAELAATVSEPSDEEEGSAKLSPDQTADPNYWRSVTNIGIQVAEAISHAHEMDVLHRDLKPANLLAEPGGKVWVADFGIAKQLDQPGLSQTGDVVGTLRYMAPEQLSGAATPQTDIFSLGLTLFELLTFRPARKSPIHPTKPVEIVLKKDIHDVRKLNPSVPKDLATIVAKAVTIDPRRRYRTAAELATDLKRFNDGRTIAAKPSSAGRRFVKWCQRNPLVASLSAFAGALVLALLLVTINSYRTELNQRQIVETALHTSIEAIDKVYDRLAPSDMSRVPWPPGVDPSQLNGEHAISKQSAVLLGELLTYYERLAGLKGDNQKLIQEIAHATHRTGEIQMKLGNWDAAIHAFEKANSKHFLLTKTTRNRLAQAITFRCLGEAQRRNHNEFQGNRCLLSAYEILQQLNDQRTREYQDLAPEIEFECANTLLLLGSFPKTPPSKRNHPGQGNDTAPRIVKPQPDQRRNMLPKTPMELGAVLPLAQWQRDEYLKMAEIGFQKLVDQFPNSPNYAVRLARCYLEQSTGLGDWHQVKAIDLLKSLVTKHPQVEQFRFNLSDAYARADVPNLQPHEIPIALEQLRNSLEISDSISNRSLETDLSSLHACHKLGSLLMKSAALAPPLEQEQKLNQAAEYVRRALRIQTGLENAETVWNQIWLTVISNTLVRILKDNPTDENIVEKARQVMETNKVRLAQLSMDKKVARQIGPLNQYTYDLARELESAAN